MSALRKAAVAGTFYPAGARQLREVVAEYLAGAKRSERVPKAMIVPHAGYVYSGSIAASAYVRLTPVRDVITRVVLLGPAHRVRLEGMALSSAEAFETPLGQVLVDQEAVAAIAELPQVVVADEAHRQEHSLEVHLPFLQEILTDFRVVPLVVGHMGAEAVAQVLDILWGGPETLIVVSSDLSHYEDYDTARKMDRATSRAIEALQPEGIGDTAACGKYPVSGLLVEARRRGLNAETIDLRNSGDTAGPKGEVVGYGAYVFGPESASESVV